MSAEKPRMYDGDSDEADHLPRPDLASIVRDQGQRLRSLERRLSAEEDRGRNRDRWQTYLMGAAAAAGAIITFLMGITALVMEMMKK